MTPEFWGDAYRLFAAALDRAPGDREAFVRDAAGGRADLRAEVSGLLAAHEASASFLEIPDVGPAVADSDVVPAGTHVGPWRLLDRLGEGGMGQVFRAERADGAFDQQVAVKLTRLSLLDRELARRFLTERAILASLNHPHIVRLIDGGTLASGQAWLAMELVTGRAIVWPGERDDRSLETRTRLLIDTCGAVHYAHQRGVVHRDLKPSNVLVDREGAVKVVDFGLARLLAGAEGTDVSTDQLPRRLTINYASPEQIRGEQATTASDVYALGVIAYELLSGQRPYDTTGRSLEEIVRTVLDREPVRPSAVTNSRWPRAHDLDAIVLKAMAKSAERRYTSAAELADDLSRYLDARPVQAREPSLGYVVRRLAKRHAVAAASVAIAAFAVVAGLGVSLWQTRIARAERLRAEARLADVRTLTNALVFKVHDAVEPLDGSTPVRRMIVQEALGYLQRLAAEQGDDPRVRLELADAYTRIGRAQGDPQRPNLGDRGGAIASLTRAIDAAEPLIAHVDDGVRRAALTSVMAAEAALVSVYQAQGAQAQARLIAESMVGHAEASTLAPADDTAHRRLATAYFTLALARGDSPEAIAAWTRSGALFEQLLAAAPDDPARMRNVALVAKYLSSAYQMQRDLVRAEAQSRRALELDERRLARTPDDRQVRLDVSNDVSDAANLAALRGDWEAARSHYARALDLRQRIADTDPADVLALEKVGSAQWRLGDSLRALGRLDEARRMASAAELTLSAVRDRTDDVIALRDLAAAHAALALVLDDANQTRAACAAGREAAKVADGVRARGAAQVWPIVDERLPRLLARCDGAGPSRRR